MVTIEETEYNIRIEIVKVRSAIDPYSSPILRDKLMKLIDQEVICLIIDLTETPFMDSAGMAVLVTALKRCRQVGGNVKLVWPKVEAAQRILKLTRFDQVFDMFDTVDAAIEQWRKA